jgi:hypothetical protein
MVGNRWHRWGQALTASALLVLLLGCQSKTTEEGGEEAVPKEKKEKTEEVAELSEGLAFLMTMTWEEAKALSAQSLEVPPFFRVAADEIQVLKAAADGTPRKVRAKGKVFIGMEFAESGRVLCQEAFLSDDELILRGKPLLQRGGSVVEGMDDVTVFYMLGTRLRVIGRHRVTNEHEMVSEMRKAEVATRKNGGEDSGFPGAPPVLPIMSGPWVESGPNPLLPPLSSESVPEEIRQKMRAEADAVNVMPLDLPGEGLMGPPVAVPDEEGKKKEPPPVKEGAPLLPVPGKPAN